MNDINIWAGLMWTFMDTWGELLGSQPMGESGVFAPENNLWIL